MSPEVTHPQLIFTLTALTEIKSASNKKVRKRKPLLSDRCTSCGLSFEHTTEIRRGPLGPNTLCNACGIKYMKATRMKPQLSDKKQSPSQNAAKLNQPQPSVVTTLPTIAQLIHLNVGGTRFTTTTSTLTGRGENFFTGLLSGKYGTAKDESGAYFVDRNGRYFEFLLDFLRTGIVLVPQDVPLEGVLREASFFCVDIAPGLSGLFEEGLYSTVMKPGEASAKGSLVMIEHTDDISVVAITGLVDKLYIEQICPVIGGKIILAENECMLQPASSKGGERGVVCFTPTKFRSSRFLEFTSKPSTDLPLTHHVFRFDYPVEQPGGEKIFSRGYLTFLGGDDGWACRIRQNQVASMYSVRILCPQLIILSTSTKPYAIIYLSGKVAFMNSFSHKFALLLRPINEEPAD